MIAAGQYSYAMHPWLYTPNIIQQGAAQQQAGQQQAQMMRGQGGRPLTPNQQGDSALGTPNPAGPQALQAQSEFELKRLKCLPTDDLVLSLHSHKSAQHNQ
jgi:hypothetical protein